MKKLLLFLLPVIALVFLMGGQRVFDNLYLVNIPHNGDSPALVISGGQVFEQDLVGVYAYLMDTPTTTTDDSARYPISGNFINEVSNGFTLSGNSIVYIGHQKILRYVISRYGTTDTPGTHIDIGVKHNGNLLTGSLGGLRLTNASDYGSTLSISQALMASGDTIQLVIRSNKNAVLTPEMITTYASSLY